MADADLIRESAMGLALIGSITILALAALRGWNGWLALKRTELEIEAASQNRGTAADPRTITARIEITDLRERVRKLEAIAAGIDI